MTISELCKKAHKIAVQKGFWVSEKGIDGDTNLMSFNDSLKDPCELAYRNNGELIALMHSELSEALEALRHDNPPSNHVPEISLLEEEMADLAIRLGDFCEARNIDLEKAIQLKMKFNETREYKHGKKF